MPSPWLNTVFYTLAFCFFFPPSMISLVVSFCLLLPFCFDFVLFLFVLPPRPQHTHLSRSPLSLTYLPSQNLVLEAYSLLGWFPCFLFLRPMLSGTSHESALNWEGAGGH